MSLSGEGLSTLLAGVDWLTQGCNSESLTIPRAGQRGIIPNFPYNNVSEMLGFLIHK
jgi:hypothetical protein